MSVDQEPKTVQGTRDWTALLDAVAEVEFERRGGLLVPAGTVVAKPAAIEPAAPAEPVVAVVVEAPVSTDIVPARVPTPLPELVHEPVHDLELPQLDERPDGRRRRRGREVESADNLRERLTADREVVFVQRGDERARKAQAAEHRIALADVEERAAAAERARRGRARDAEEGDALAELYRRATRSGARAQIRTQIQGSAEMRALRVAMVRKVTLMAGLPVLAAFAAWSTTNVQSGVVRLLDLDANSPAWWASWGMEPALITVVALIITGRAVLRSSGGTTDWKATVAEWTALSLSLALAIFGGLHTDAGFWGAMGGALPHAIGPLGCAGTAFLIGLFDSYATAAQPWKDAPRLADLDLVPPSAATGTDDVRTGIKRGKHGPDGGETADLPDDVRKLLEAVEEAIEDGLLPPDPSGYAIYKRVMGSKGDRARAGKVAGLVAGWRPELRAV